MDRRHHLIALLLGTAFAQTARADYRQESFLPDNNAYLQDCLECESGITQAQFNETIDKARQIYGSVITGFGGSLDIQARWTDATVNANAIQLGSVWQVNMYGGLARRAEVTQDGFAMVLCHELGHHLAGFPFVSTWAANEGQADYFATSKCAHLYWDDQPEVNATFRATIPATPKAKCDAAWDTEGAQNVCYRAMMAGKSLGDLLANLGGTTISWDTPDTSVVTSTDDAHPAAQCRLDTYMAGADCTAEYDPSYIPGKRNGRGQNDVQAETDSARYSCTAPDYAIGTRPLCWFKPGI